MEIKEAENSMLKYYCSKNISPVHQDISDLCKHFSRREKLYRQCGVPAGFLQGKNVLEIGPGSGYNTLAFFQWGASKVDLVEPNSKGREDMLSLFAEHGIDKECFEIFPLAFEEFANISHRRDYDFVVCEGFIQQAAGARDIFLELLNFPKPGGVMVWTCMDPQGLFVEYLKRVAALGMTCGVASEAQREDRLVEIFAPQLKKLFGVSRPPRDWVQDQILNPNGNGKDFFRLGEALDDLPENFHLLGSSPQLIRDISWYKDLRHPQKKDMMADLKSRLATLLLAGSPEVCLAEADGEALEQSIRSIMAYGQHFEEQAALADLVQIAIELQKMKNLASRVSEDFRLIIEEAADCFAKLGHGENIDFIPYPHWAGTFGRAMSYMAAQRDMEYA